MLTSELGRRLVALSGDGLDDEIINDAYKPRMHNLYALLMPGVQARGRYHTFVAGASSLSKIQAPVVQLMCSEHKRKH